MLLPLLGHRINKMQVYLWISTDANYFMLSLVIKFMFLAIMIKGIKWSTDTFFPIRELRNSKVFSLSKLNSPDTNKST